MGTSNGSNKMERIAFALKTGRTREDVAAEFGVKPSTVESYRVRYLAKERPRKPDNYSHCGCGLRLYGNEEFPGMCYTCGVRGGMHAVDFMRSGIVAAVLSPSLASSFREI